MAEHEAAGISDEWYTPPRIFERLGCRFDLDPCAGQYDFVPANNRFFEGGLDRPWQGFVWLNPPFGGRNGILPWLQRFVSHGNGIAIVPNRTATDWWQGFARRCDALLFVQGKIRFIRPNGVEGGSPGYGNVMGAIGERAVVTLKLSAIPGLWVEPK